MYSELCEHFLLLLEKGSARKIYEIHDFDRI